LLLTTLLALLGPTFGQEVGQKTAEPAEKTGKEKAAAPEKPASKPELPFQIQLLETHVRFEANGDSRKEVHTIVKINNVLGAHQFARLTFDYNRAFQQVEIPLVRISHADGGTSELLPSAVVDAPNPAVEKFPAYQDVRVKSVRILGLQEGDTIEYRVITTTTKHPLAPDFWLEHTFDRSGQVLEEIYKLDLPVVQNLQIRINPKTPPDSTNKTGEGELARSIYIWHISTGNSLPDDLAGEHAIADIALTTFKWETLESKLQFQLSYSIFPPEFEARVRQLTASFPAQMEKIEWFYELVSNHIRTADLPFGATGYSLRDPLEILSSGYATPEEKCALLSALVGSLQDSPMTYPVLILATDSPEKEIARPTLVSNVLVTMTASEVEKDLWLDPALEVAPIGMIPLDLRGRTAIPLVSQRDGFFGKVPARLPFGAYQRVGVNAKLAESGSLSAKVKYTLRGDNELLLRVAFHQTAKEKWKDVAGLLAISDGFRGQVTSVNVSDPLATKDPFTVEYEITQAKFVDWSKKPVRIPALLPQIGLPDPPAKQAAGEAARTIELGTPLDVDTQMTLKLPAGTTAQTPAGTSVERDYAKFSSKYSTLANTVTASRRVNFLLREIPGERAMDYSAFVRAVQSDQAQVITLVREAADEAKPAKATPKQ
jgi:hypothetical protein